MTSLVSRRFGGRASLALLVLPALLLVFELATWDHVAPGVVALGTPVGNLSRAAATERLTQRVQELLDRQVNVQAADQTWDRSARDLGLRLAVEDIVATSYAVGRTGNPIERLQAQLGSLFKGTDVGLGSPVDKATLEAAVRQIAKKVDRPVIDAAVSIDAQGTIRTTQAQVGRTVEVADSTDRLARALMAGTDAVQLVVRQTQPKVTDAMAEPARLQAQRLLGGPNETPMVLTFQDQQLPLTKGDVGSMLKIQARPDGRLEVGVDDGGVAWLARVMMVELHQETVDARFSWNGGNLKVLRPSSAGRDLDETATKGLLRAALTNGTRTVALPVSITPPAVSSDDPKALGVRELIDRGSTSFAGSIPEKKANIKLAAEKINGAVVPPGGTFSFNKEVGPTTVEAGFQWGFAIEGGSSGPKTVPSVAGGICQVATTLFQPVFWAGYALEERYSHAYWIPAYTSRGVVGLDVTVDPDTNLDFKWKNPTNDYVLIQAGVQGDTVEFALYGRKPSWRVDVEPAKVSNERPSDPTPVQQEEPSLPQGRTLQVESARDGFDVEVTRTVSPLAGGDPRTLRLRTSYQPSRTVTLIGTASHA